MPASETVSEYTLTPRLLPGSPAYASSDGKLVLVLPGRRAIRVPLRQPHVLRADTARRRHDVAHVLRHQIDIATGRAETMFLTHEELVSASLCMAEPAELSIVRASESRWDELCNLFGRAGADNGCWCQYWLLGSEYHRRDRNRNAKDLESSDSRTPRGVVGFEPLSLACFFIHRKARDEGVMAALIAGAKEEGRKRKKPVEIYPIDPTVPGATRNRFPGVLAPFRDAGFSMTLCGGVGAQSAVS